VQPLVPPKESEEIVVRRISRRLERLFAEWERKPKPENPLTFAKTDPAPVIEVDLRSTQKIPISPAFAEQLKEASGTAHAPSPARVEEEITQLRPVRQQPVFGAIQSPFAQANIDLSIEESAHASGNSPWPGPPAFQPPTPPSMQNSFSQREKEASKSETTTPSPAEMMIPETPAQIAPARAMPPPPPPPPPKLPPVPPPAPKTRIPVAAQPPPAPTSKPKPPLPSLPTAPLAKPIPEASQKLAGTPGLQTKAPPPAPVSDDGGISISAPAEPAAPQPGVPQASKLTQPVPDSAPAPFQSQFSEAPASQIFAGDPVAKRSSGGSSSLFGSSFLLAFLVTVLLLIGVYFFLLRTDMAISF
jgi:hypothetical protein